MSGEGPQASGSEAQGEARKRKTWSGRGRRTLMLSRPQVLWDRRPCGGRRCAGAPDCVCRCCRCWVPILPLRSCRPIWLRRDGESPSRGQPGPSATAGTTLHTHRGQSLCRSRSSLQVVDACLALGSSISFSHSMLPLDNTCLSLRDKMRSVEIRCSPLLLGSDLASVTHAAFPCSSSWDWLWSDEGLDTVCGQCLTRLHRMATYRRICFDLRFQGM